MNRCTWQADLPFLNFVLGRAIAEHPDYLELLMFQLVVLRFIFSDGKQVKPTSRALS